MISIIPNTSIFRKVPFQSGNYSVELDINLGNHFNDVDFILSGGGSTFFKFGSNSGHYYSSGVNKLYFDSTIPNTDLSYTFVISDNSFDVYNGDTAVILNALKATGRLDRIITKTTVNAEGEFSLILRGNRPDFKITSGMTFPINGSFVDGLVVTNTTSIPFSILSGTFDTINNISGANKFPLFLDSYNSGVIGFSGRLASISNPSISFVVNADFVNTANVITITGTQFSGSGYTISSPTPSDISFGNFDNQLWVIKNTGTLPLRFSPTISKMVTGINITPPTYSGVNLKNHFSGYFDTPSQFYFTDKITWSGGAFHIIEQNNTGINIFNITGESHTGLFVGTLTNNAVGETFTLPYDYQITGISAKLATNDSGFFGTDFIFVSIFRGNGVSGQRLGNSDSVLCSNIPFSLESGDYFNFKFPLPIDITANNPYSIVISGSPTFVGNISSVPPRSVYILQTTGSVFNGSGFEFLSPNTIFDSGNAFFKLDWIPAIDANRYKINVLSGDITNFNTVYSGIYDKYQGYLSFSFTKNNFEALPNSPINFEMSYTGLVSGMNFARLTFDSLDYSTIISGLTT